MTSAGCCSRKVWKREKTVSSWDSNNNRGEGKTAQAGVKKSILDRGNSTFFVILLRYNLDKPENSYARIRIFPRKREDENHQQLVHGCSTPIELIYLLGVINSVYNDVFANESSCTCNVLLDKIAAFQFLSFVSLFGSGWVGILVTKETSSLS